MDEQPEPLRVSIVALPEAMASTLNGLSDALSGVSLLPELFAGVAPSRGIAVEIVGPHDSPVTLTNGLPQAVHRGHADVTATDIVIVPSLLVPGGDWRTGRYDPLVAWAARMHAGGAAICSACSGLYLLAESGLFDGAAATIHWSYAPGFARTFPQVAVHPERPLVVAGARDELISCGASTSWQDLVLYLVARFVGATAAQMMAKFYAMQWHEDGLSPYIVFTGATGHGDAVVEEAQAWLEANFSVANPVEQMVRRAGVAERSFGRRFAKATGLAPLAYVQRLRVEDAKRRLERSDDPVDEIGWRVGYEDPAFFRRLFRRVTGLTPAAYRRRFRGPLVGN